MVVGGWRHVHSDGSNGGDWACVPRARNHFYGFTGDESLRYLLGGRVCVCAQVSELGGRRGGDRSHFTFSSTELDFTGLDPWGC